MDADDIRIVATHEAGHVLGLDHSKDSTTSCSRRRRSGIFGPRRADGDAPVSAHAGEFALSLSRRSTHGFVKQS